MPRGRYVDVSGGVWQMVVDDLLRFPLSISHFTHPKTPVAFRLLFSSNNNWLLTVYFLRLTKR
jgi:hypothetical protein